MEQERLEEQWQQQQETQDQGGMQQNDGQIGMLAAGTSQSMVEANGVSQTVTGSVLETCVKVEMNCCLGMKFFHIFHQLLLFGRLMRMVDHCLRFHRSKSMNHCRYLSILIITLEIRIFLLGRKQEALHQQVINLIHLKTRDTTNHSTLESHRKRTVQREKV